MQLVVIELILILTILRTKYCPMSVFVCQLATAFISFQVISPANICEDGALGNNAIANVMFYWAMVLHAVSSCEFLVYCVSSLLSPSCGSTLFQTVPGGSSSFQLVSAHSRGGSSSVQLVPAHSR